MKALTYHPGIRQSERLYHLAQQARARLEEVLGPSAGQVSAEWDRGEDGRGRPVVTLKLTDWTGSVTATFDPTELENPVHVRQRLVRLWGDLLQERSHRQLRELMGTASAGGD
jgi:hypothetical protein